MDVELGHEALGDLWADAEEALEGALETSKFHCMCSPREQNTLTSVASVKLKPLRNTCEGQRRFEPPRRQHTIVLHSRAIGLQKGGEVDLLQRCSVAKPPTTTTYRVRQ
jgi:hypothetical protein